MTWNYLTLYSLTSEWIFSKLLLDISKGSDKENLFNNQKPLSLMIISFILMTLMFDLGVMLSGEIRC